MTDEEIAQMVRDEWARPAVPASKSDVDAFDYFAMQEQRKSSLVTYVYVTLNIAALVLFLGALVIAPTGISIPWALGFALTACVLLFVATLLGTFAK